MNGKTYPYLDLVALAPVGGALLDPRPAFVFAGDGSRVLWANAAGAAFFDEPSMSALLDRRFGGQNPLKAQAARLARLLPIDASRLEILRVGQGVSLASLPAACRRLNLADGSTAALAVGVNGTTTESIVTRAERLADLIAGPDCLAAVLDRDGKVLGASGGFDELEGAGPDIDALIEASVSANGVIKRRLTIGGSERPAGAAGFAADGRQCFLLIVGPVEARVELPPQAPVAEAAEPMAGTPADAPETEPLVESAPAPAPVARFIFTIDPQGYVATVSPELAAVVGPENAAIVGRPWTSVADLLGLDVDGSIARALAGAAPWSAATAWPLGDGEAIAVDLTAFPAGKDGFYGFGAFRLNDRRPDQRREPGRLADLAATVPLAEPPPAPAITPAPEPPEAAPPASPAATESAALPTSATEPPSLPTNDDLDDMARKIIEEGAPARPPHGTQPSPPQEEPAATAAPSNIVRLPHAGRTPPERLTGMEQDAFRRIAETLGVRTAADAAAESVEPAAGPAPPVRKEIAKAPATEIDTRLLDRLPIGLVVFREGRTLFANRMLLDLVGYDSFAAFIEAGGAEAVFPGGAEAWAGGLAENGGRLAARRRDGGSIAVDVRLHAVPWSGANALMLSLSPRKEPPAIESGGTDLARSSARTLELETILDTATDGVIVVDRSGKIGSINRAGEALFGVEAGEWIGRSFTGLLAEESHKSALDYLDGLAANGVASVLNDGREVIGKVPQGGLIPLFMTMGRLGESGKFCAVLRDITHWKNVEEELVAARRAAETANAQKSDFLAKISHEIRTPLNAIIGFSEVMMEERFGPVGNDRYRSYLRDIHVSGAHLMSLINDLLDLSKIEAGKLELQFEAVAVNAAIQECVALMQPQANRERIIIRTSLAAEVPDVVADPRSLRQILLNLLSNAIKFTRAGGQVIVSSALEGSGEVTVRIRDTGVGMSEKDIETALKPFRQVATAKSGDQRGTGLGLPLTKALVEANRAAFSIDSAVEQGTLVRITFPTTRVLAG